MIDIFYTPGAKTHSQPSSANVISRPTFGSKKTDEQIVTKNRMNCDVVKLNQNEEHQNVDQNAKIDANLPRSPPVSAMSPGLGYAPKPCSRMAAHV